MVSLQVQVLDNVGVQGIVPHFQGFHAKVVECIRPQRLISPRIHLLGKAIPKEHGSILIPLIGRVVA
jgi:hypothetical protein